jgi:internalin A
MTNLDLLHLNNNRIGDLAPLAGLKKLWHLYLANNEIKDLAPLAGLKNLWELSLDNNRIGDLAPLAGLKNLRNLGLSNTPQTKAQIAALQKALPDCRIRTTISEDA